MILTAGFYGDSGLILFGKIEWSNTMSNKGRCSKILRKREMAMKDLWNKLSNARFGENLDDFWPRYCRAMKRNCNCVTCRPFFSGLSCFLTAERKGKFTSLRSDFLFS